MITTTDYIIRGILLSIIVWIIKEIIIYFVRRDKIRYSTINDINSIINTFKESNTVLNKFFSQEIKENQKISRKPHYERETFLFFNTFHKDFVSYYRKKELINIFKLYRILSEQDYLYYRLAKVIAVLHDEEKIIDKKQLIILKRKKRRIENLIKTYTKKDEIKKVIDIPEDYRGRQTSEVIIEE